MIKHILILFLAGQSTACSVSGEIFDCKYSKGVGCHSITEVNKLLNEGKLKTFDAKARNTFKNSNIISDNSTLKRVTEEHLRIWLAPHQDEQGHFHEGSIVHTVLRSGFWQMQ